jgi:Domain of unknown function (DUF6916)
MLAELKRSHFAEHVHGTVRIHVGEGTVDAELTAVVALGESGAGDVDAKGNRLPFSLFYRGPLTPVLPQRIYPVEHPGLGILELFLVPVGPDDGAMCYEAVFT